MGSQSGSPWGAIMKSRTRTDRRISRRDLFKTGAAFAVTAAVPILSAGAAQVPTREDGGTLEPTWRQSPASSHRILLKGGTVVSMDPNVGDFIKGDVLIEGTKIVDVAREVRAPAQVQLIDASNTIVIPGFVDSHRHSWEGQLRRIIPNGAIDDYM